MRPQKVRLIAFFLLGVGAFLTVTSYHVPALPGKRTTSYSVTSLQFDRWSSSTDRSGSILLPNQPNRNILLSQIPSLFKRSQTLAQSVTERKAEADRLYQQGRQQVQTSQYQEAFQSFEQALKIYREIKDRSSEALTINYLALVENRRSNYIQAFELYQQALAIFRELGDRWNEGTVLNNLGTVSLNRGQYPEALNFFQQALEIRREVGDKEGEGVTLDLLGQFYSGLADHPQALNYFQQALALRREVGDKEGEALTLNGLGFYYRNLGQYSQASDFYQQALTIFRQLGSRQGEATILNNLGDVELNLSHYPQALEFFQQSLDIYKEIGTKSEQGTTLGNIGRVYAAQGQYTQALKFFQQALIIHRDLGNRVGEGRQLKNMGNAFYQSGKLVEAEKTLREGIEVFESLRQRLNDANKVSLFETQLATYRLLQKVLIVQNKPNEALEIAERGRSRALVELLAQQLTQSESLITSPSLAEIKKIAETHQSTLVEYAIIPDQLSFQTSKTEQESELYIWVIKPTGEVTFRSFNLKTFLQKQNVSLKDLVIDTRESIGLRGIFVAEAANSIDEKTQTQRLQQLHQLLIDPITDLLPTDPNERVIFIPQGELFLVPFAALQDKQGRYLIEKHTLLTSPSIQVLNLTHQQRERIEALQATSLQNLILGNPTMPRVSPKIGDKPQKLPDLPGAKREAEAIAPLLNTQALTGNAATKAAVLERLPKARYVHLATHGLFDDFQGLQSAIALAPTGTDNGLLTAEEILNLKLNAELVVLSACDTGRGRITGDGVIGLSRSLISAGVPSVIVSLWSVPDAPTAELMTEFYRQLQQTGDKAQSLRQAMLKLKAQYPNSPKKWAAFTLIGEAD